MNRLLSATLVVLAVTAWSSEGWARKTARHKCDVNSWVTERLDNWKQQLARSTPADPSPIVGTYDRTHGALLPTCANGPLTNRPGPEPERATITTYFKKFLEDRPVVKFETQIVGGVCGNAFASGLYNFTLNGGSGATLRARYTYVFQGDVRAAPIMQHHSSLEPRTPGQQCPIH
jgi:hypothetical protein